MTDSDGFYIPRPEHPALLQLLEQIPSLCDDLAITLTKQDRISAGGPRVRTGSDEQPLPYSPEASDAADLLHNTLHSWVRHVCEQRHLEPPHRNDTLHHARWLHRWHLALALTEGAQEAPSEIRYAIGVARRSVDRPREKDRDVNPIDVLEATFVRLNAAGIAKLAGELGPQYRTLNERRVATLLKAKAITVIDTVDGLDLYRVGDVLTAHLAYPTRNRKAA